MRMRNLFRMMIEKNASDLFLRAYTSPHARINGKIHSIDDHEISVQEITAFVDFLLANDVRRTLFAKNLDIDFIHYEEGAGRFRINIFTQRGTPAIVARYVAERIGTFDELYLPAQLCQQFCEQPRGLVLVCGPAGSGKSTTIASMVEHINAEYARHIVTIEDPVEFVFRDKKSIINQRELGMDVHSYPLALRYVTQQSPDLIFIGTIRDPETMKAAISAAELGVLVMSTFHTINAIQTIQRIVNFFPPYLHDEIRMQLSLLLKGVISLRLIPRKDGTGRIPACETMVVTPTIARLIREGSVNQIQGFIDEGKLFGMKSFKQAMVELVNQGLVAEEEARQLAESKDEFALEMRGITRFGS